MTIVLKIGGSLIKEAPQLIDRLIEEFGSEGCPNNFLSKNPSGPGDKKQTPLIPSISPVSILIVPGGGVFADAVRAVDKKFSLSSNAAHWMAILGMEQYACYLQDKSKFVSSVDSIENLPRGVSVLFPYKLLKARDPLPHTWDVSSDTIAAWVGKEIGASLIKVTDVDGIYREGKLAREVPCVDITENIKEENIKEGVKGDTESCIDIALPSFLLESRMDCLIVNGKYPERVIQAIYGKPVPGTKVKGNI